MYFKKLRGLFTIGLSAMLTASLPALAGPASFDESTGRMVEACVDPQIGGVTQLRKKDNEPKTHTLTFQFSNNYSEATIIAGNRVPKEDCTAIFNLATGRITDQIMYNDELQDVVLQYTGGLSFSVVTFPLPAIAEGEQTSLWRVTNGSNEVYVGGVVYISESDFWPVAFGMAADRLRAADFPLPDGFEEAYENSDQLILRSVPSQVLAQAINLQGLTLNTQSNLLDDVGQDLYDQLDTFITPILQQSISGLPFRAFWWADLVDLLLAIGDGYVDGTATYFKNKAEADFKVIFGLEEADDQMSVININKIDADKPTLISDALAQTENENFTAEIDALLDAWRTGDDDYLYDVLTKPDHDGDLTDYNRKYTERYVTWLNVFDDMLESSDKVEFVLMDVRYLVGDDSFLVTLENAGYTVERY